MTRPIVLTTYGRENVLGYIDDRQPKVFGILATSVIKGAVLSRFDGWSFLPTKADGSLDQDAFRPATLEDFKMFNVSPYGYSFEGEK